MSSKPHGLIPQTLKEQPAHFQDRNKILQKVYDQLKNCRLKANNARLVRMSIQLEATVAKGSKSAQGYRFNMSVLLRDIIKHKGDFRKIKVLGQPLLAPKKGTAPDASTYTTSKPEVLAKLVGILVDPALLKKHGYILTRELDPTLPDHTIYTHCARCNTKFRKDEILKDTVCMYHPQKKIYNRETKTHVYSCCGESTASTSFLRLGCEKAKHHVFKSESYNDLHEISEFLNTNVIDGEVNVLALDCEMAYTSKGFEMVRLTIVDFFTSKTLFDEIIDPFGEILDLNTQFSGIHEEDMKKAITYQDVMDRILTPSFINKNSILMGHGLENDLNVMRIIHDRIIDTAILYSTGRYKSSLKNLTFETLSEKIQTGEHDSSQDAIATMNVIKKKIGVSVHQTEW
ncbi:RNA exonuclease [Maudiozyma humilis]|uniref:RNA exonuclease 3 n=1 Tax=Maudiozyma humilis TaxID=51915 RepID=A0AAV5RX52_MAUHU|nr:RNA exonuclease [Kazachstania humilis]